MINSYTGKSRVLGSCTTICEIELNYMIKVFESPHEVWIHNDTSKDEKKLTGLPRWLIIA